MARSNHFLLVAVVGVAVAAFLGEASGIGFDLHHKSSAVVRQWAEARGYPMDAPWPEQGSPEYYHELSRHDRALLARRGLAGADGLVSFSPSNATIQLSSLGFLYYAFVTVGTPKSMFLVALDTGSDLFWVPCDCKQCAPLDTFNATLGVNLQPYSPRLSSTSKPVTCAHALCERPNACAGGGNSTTSCPYGVRYVSANTSSSGVLVEDLLHLTSGGALQQAASIVFGCGQLQTGLFLQGGAPDGLLGLGMEKISVPSALATSGIVASNSFSMCFGAGDSLGRLNFGDTGSTDQSETPFLVSTFHPSYNVSFTSINVGADSLPAAFTAIMDSGTSFTYLNEPEYSTLANSFDSQVRERRTNFTSSSGSIPFDYCYALSTGQTQPQVIPKMSLTTKGGAEFPVLDPAILLVDRSSTGKDRAVGYCLAIIRNDITVNIIGQNFMTGLKVVFNRDKSVLGWQEFDCYKNAAATGTPDAGSPATPDAGSPPPPRAARSPPPSLLWSPPPPENDGNTTFPDAEPVPPMPRRASSGHAACKLGGLSLLLPLLIAALV